MERVSLKLFDGSDVVKDTKFEDKDKDTVDFDYWDKVPFSSPLPFPPLPFSSLSLLLLPSMVLK